MFSLVSASRLNKENTRQLTRLHVHTLAYQAILTVKNSPWKNSKAAAAKASLTANRHVCGSKEVSLLCKLINSNQWFKISDLVLNNVDRCVWEFPVRILGLEADSLI